MPRLSKLLPFRSGSRLAVAESSPSPTLVTAAPVKGSWPCGLDVVAEGVDPVIDIVAIHGLNGHRDKTWTAANGVHWLRDLLPQDVANARILCWGYDANTHSGSQTGCQYLYDHATTLVSDLCLFRKQTDSTMRPIVFVAHSLGGIVVKSALIHSDLCRQGALEEHNSIRTSTFGIFFMGTPHQGGGGVEVGMFLVNIAKLFIAADNRLLKHLKPNSEWLQLQQGQFVAIGSDFVTKYVYEKHETKTALGHSIMVVPRASAVVPGHTDAEPIGIDADHRNMVRFSGKDDNGYKTISGHICEMTGRASEVIQLRWRAKKGKAAEAGLGLESTTQLRANSNSNSTAPEVSGISFAIDFSLPATLPFAHFVAREEELTEISRLLHSRDGPNVVVIHGLGGMGKTQLAKRYATRQRDDYSAVFWFNARDRNSLQQSFVAAGERISLQHPTAVDIKHALQSKDLERAVSSVKKWLEFPGNQHWLAIYDNYDMPAFGDDEKPENNGDAESDGPDSRGTDVDLTAYDIRPFLPDAYRGATIITTRSSRVQLGNRITLNKLRNLDDSLKILEINSRRQNLQEDADAVRLAEKLDGLPLALSTAGAYLENVSTSFAEYLQLHDDSWLRLQETSPSLLSYPEKSLYSTWNITFEQIQKRNFAASMLLRLWGYFDNNDLWFELLEAGRNRGLAWFQHLVQDSLGFSDAIRLLCEFGLIEATSPPSKFQRDSRGYGMHSCVHLWTTHVLSPLQDDNLAELALWCISNRYAYTTDDYLVLSLRLMPHAERCSELIMRGLGQGGIKSLNQQALIALAHVYAQLGRDDEATVMYEETIERAEQPHVSDNHRTAMLLNYGVFLMHHDQLCRAEAVLREALELSERAPADEQARQLILFRLGIILGREERFDEAISVLYLALHSLELLRRSEDLQTARVVEALGDVFLETNRTFEAAVMLKRLAKAYTKLFGPDSLATISVGSSMGGLLEKTGQLEAAEEMLTKYARELERILGPEHFKTLQAKVDLGIFFIRANRLDDAEAMLDRLLQSLGQTTGVPALSLYSYLGDLRGAQSRLDEAVVMYEQSLAGFKAILGPFDVFHNRFVGHNILALGVVYQLQGRKDEAMELCLWLQAGLLEAFGENYGAYQRTSRALAFLESDQGSLSFLEACREVQIELGSH